VATIALALILWTFIVGKIELLLMPCAGICDSSNGLQ